MRLLILAFLVLATTAARAGEEVRELTIGGHVVQATLRLPAQPGPDMPVVLMTHGTLAHKDMETIQSLSKALAERGIASLAHTLALGVDRRKGMYDCSIGHDYTADDAVAEIDAWVVEAAKVSRRVYVLGHSRGGNEVARYLASQPTESVAGAVLLAPATATVESGLRAGYAATFGEALEPWLGRAEAKVAAGRGDEWMTVPGFIYCRGGKVTARAFAAFYRADRRQDTAALIADLDTPVLVLAAAQDRTVPDVESSFGPLAAGATGRVWLETIEGADHYFLDLAADDAADRIASFVAAAR